jgi:hypothetical protein
VLIIDVHGKWTAGSAGPLASGVRFSSRHCKGASTQQFRHAHLFPLLQINDQCHHQPYQLLRSGSGRILAKKSKLSIAGLSVAIGDAEKRPSTTTLQNSTALFYSRCPTSNSTALF